MVGRMERLGKEPRTLTVPGPLKDLLNNSFLQPGHSCFHAVNWSQAQPLFWLGTIWAWPELLDSESGQIHIKEDIYCHYRLKPLNQVRDLFRIRTCRVKGFKANFCRKKAVCEECGCKTDTQSHAMECPGYKDLREGLDLNQDIYLVKYFRNVLKRRGL